MGRQRRPYLPGAIFHLTARTIRREHLFTPAIRSAAIVALTQALPRSRMRLLAVAIMSNHLHLVVQQGDRPLSALMQPFLRRLALRVQRAYGFDGPVFWRHYASRPCLHPTHARNAIVYTHLNPVRAGLCADPSEYSWSSHALYAASPGVAGSRDVARLTPAVDATLALPLFASGTALEIAQLRDDYRAFVRRRMELDAGSAADPEGPNGDGHPEDEPPVPREPETEHRMEISRVRPIDAIPGEVPWWSGSSPLFRWPGATRAWPGGGPGAALPDLATVALNVLSQELPGASLESVRGRRGGRARSRARHAIISRLHETGYRNVQIARFLDLSESAVSGVICRRS